MVDDVHHELYLTALTAHLDKTAKLQIHFQPRSRPLAELGRKCQSFHFLNFSQRLYVGSLYRVLEKSEEMESFCILYQLQLHTELISFVEKKM